MALAAILVPKFLSNGEGEPPYTADEQYSDHVHNRMCVCVCVCVCVCLYLLHVSQDVLPAVKDSFALFTVQLVDEVSGVVLTAVLIPVKHTHLTASTHIELQDTHE